MFSTGWIKGIILGAVLLAVGGSIYGVYNYVTDLQAENSRLTSDNATYKVNEANLEAAIETQNTTIASLQADIETQSRIFRQTNDQFNQARAQVDALRERLGRHELAALARAKPQLVENVINNATDAVGRCLEIASGAPLTEAERNATLPSQINRECPDLANPNYKGD